jgi:hypothetical protein
MMFFQWVSPLLDYYPHERIIFTDYIRPNKRGTFSVTRQKGGPGAFRGVSSVSVQGQESGRKTCEAL